MHFFFEFCFWEVPPHPVNWSPTHSTGPQTLFFTDISVLVAQIKKIKKQGAFFFKFCFWEDPPHPVNWCPTHSIGPLICFLLNFRACFFIGFPFVYHYFWGRVMCQLDIFYDFFIFFYIFTPFSGSANLLKSSLKN